MGGAHAQTFDPAGVTQLSAALRIRQTGAYAFVAFASEDDNKMDELRVPGFSLDRVSTQSGVVQYRTQNAIATRRRGRKPQATFREVKGKFFLSKLITPSAFVFVTPERDEYVRDGLSRFLYRARAQFTRARLTSREMLSIVLEMARATSSKVVTNRSLIRSKRNEATISYKAESIKEVYEYARESNANVSGFDFSLISLDGEVLLRAGLNRDGKLSFLSGSALANEQSKPTRPLIIFSVAFDTQQAKSRWVLSCITDLSDRFSDSKLPEDARLSVRHQDHEEPIVIYIAEYAALQATQAFCNDRPPAVYTAVILWARVLPKLIPDDQRKMWALEANLQGTVEFLTSMDAIVAESHRQRLVVKRAHIFEALSLLEASKLVISQDGKLRVRYRRFRSARGDYEDDEAAEAAMDHTKRGLVREIARSVKSKRKPKTRTPLSRRSKSDPNQLPLL